MTPRHQLLFAGLMGGLVACVLVCGLFLWKMPPRMQIVKVDLSSLLKEEAWRVSKQHLSPEAEKAVLHQSKERLMKILSRQTPHLIVLNASSVLSPQVPDLTDVIGQHYLEEGRLQKGPDQ